MAEWAYVISMTQLFSSRLWGPFQYHSRSDIASLHMRIVEIERGGQSARILPIHAK